MYKKSGGKEVELKEVGPRFELRCKCLRYLFLHEERFGHAGVLILLLRLTYTCILHVILGGVMTVLLGMGSSESLW